MLVVALSHNYSCVFCGRVDACELSSIQFLTPSGRVGVDLFECLFCGVRYIIGMNHQPELTKKSYKQLAREIGELALDRYEHPEKYVKEKDFFEKQLEENRNSLVQKIFRKALEEGLNGKGVVQE